MGRPSRLTSHGNASHTMASAGGLGPARHHDDLPQCDRGFVRLKWQHNHESSKPLRSKGAVNKQLQRAKRSSRHRKEVSTRTHLNKYANRSREIKEPLNVHRLSGSNESLQVPATQGEDHGCQSKTEKEVANRDQSQRAAACSPRRRSTAPERAENGLPFLGLQRPRYCCLIGRNAAANRESFSFCQQTCWSDEMKGY